MPDSLTHQEQHSTSQHSGQPSPRAEAMSGAVCIFAKTPRLGQVKTRLAPALGEQGCLDLHRWLVEHRVQSLTETQQQGTQRYENWLYVTDDVDDPYWQQLTERFPMPMQLQRGQSLGERMHSATVQALAQKDWVILVGADCPDLDSDYIQLAIDALQEGAEVVVGPAEDGGYVLLGLKQVRAELFSGIDWGTERVLSQTLAAINASLNANLSAHKKPDGCQLLPTLRDLDVIEDFLYYSDKIAALSTLPVISETV